MLNGRGLPLAVCLALAALTLSPVRAWNQWTWRGAGPGQRAAHSLHVFKNHVYLFGGRSNDTVVPHRPKTYEIQEIDGVISFASYDEQLVTSCSENDTALTCLDITKGVLHNDIWRYQLGACPCAHSSINCSCYRCTRFVFDRLRLLLELVVSKLRLRDLLLLRSPVCHSLLKQ